MLSILHFCVMASWEGKGESEKGRGIVGEKRQI